MQLELDNLLVNFVLVREERQGSWGLVGPASVERGTASKFNTLPVQHLRNFGTPCTEKVLNWVGLELRRFIP